MKISGPYDPRIDRKERFSRLIHLLAKAQSDRSFRKGHWCLKLPKKLLFPKMPIVT